MEYAVNFNELVVEDLQLINGGDNWVTDLTEKIGKAIILGTCTTVGGILGSGGGPVGTVGGTAAGATVGVILTEIIW